MESQNTSQATGTGRIPIEELLPEEKHMIQDGKVETMTVGYVSNISGNQKTATLTHKLSRYPWRDEDGKKRDLTLDVVNGSGLLKSTGGRIGDIEWVELEGYEPVERTEHTVEFVIEAGRYSMGSDPDKVVGEVLESPVFFRVETLDSEPCIRMYARGTRDSHEVRGARVTARTRVVDTLDASEERLLERAKKHLPDYVVEEGDIETQRRGRESTSREVRHGEYDGFEYLDSATVVN